MNVYELNREKDEQGIDLYQSLLLTDVATFRRLKEHQQRDGWFENFQPIGDAWFPVKVVVNEDEQDLLLHSDCPYLPTFSPTTPIFSQRTVEVLGDLLEDSGELLPLICDSGNYYVFNITNEVAALDNERSEFKFYSEVYDDLCGDQDFQLVTKFAFVGNQVTDLNIFRLPRCNHHNMPLVTDRFLERVRSSDLRGFAFNLLWSNTEYQPTVHV
jgi:hypothetical protein